MFMVNRRLSAKEERLYQAFKRLDVDDDGKITVLELQAGTSLGSRWSYLMALHIRACKVHMCLSMHVFCMCVCL
jgi:hypothetical protein